MNVLGRFNRLFPIAVIAAVAAAGVVAILVSFVYCARPINPYNVEGDQGRGIDCVMRFAEVDCLRTGVNPYRVWNRDVNHALYYSSTKAGSTRSVDKLPVNAYTPWEYTYMYPLSLVRSWDMRWIMFNGVRFLLYAAMMIYFFYRAFLVRLRFMDGCFCIACTCLVAGAIYADLMPNNLSCILTAFACGMLICLNAGRDCLAGVFWALLMIKPQFGLLFAIPLLLDKRIKTIFVAMAICIVATVPPVVMCGESPVALITQAPAASVHAFCGCGLMPVSLYRKLVESGVSSGIVLCIPAMLGVFVCSVSCWFVRQDRDAFIRAMPCVVFSLCWTYVQSYSYCFAALAIFALARDAIRSVSLRRRFFDIIAIVLFSDVGYTVVRMAMRILGRCGPNDADEISDFTRQLSSSLSVVACLVWCWWTGRVRGDEHTRGQLVRLKK